MKSVYLAAVVGVFAASAVNAQCACVPTDSACLSECVGQTNNCIAACRSNDCYSSCISNHWPGVDPNSSEVSSVVALASSTADTKPSAWSSAAVPTSSWSSTWSETSGSAAPTTSSVWSQSSAAWTSSSAWSSGSTWIASHTASGSVKPSGMNPAASASILPASAATTTQMSKVIFGLGLACAAYILQ